jgi:hypothetical protein
VTPKDKLMAAVQAIGDEMEVRVGELEAQGRELEGAGCGSARPSTSR